MKKAYILLLMVLALLVANVAMVSAAPLPVVIEKTRVDGTEVDPVSTTRLDVKRDQLVEVKIKFHSTEDLENIDLRAYIAGYEYADYDVIGDLIHVGDLEENVTYVEELELSLPDDVDADDYQLRIEFADRNSESLRETYSLKVDRPRHEVKVQDVIVYPENEVKAGSALLVTVRLDNQGQKDEDDVKVTVRVPQLGLSATAYVDELDDGDERETEELYMRVPKCAEPGLYDLEVEVVYDKNDRKTYDEQINVVADDTCSPAAGTTVTAVTAGNDMQTVTEGQGVIFPVTVSNGESVAKSFSLTVAGTSGWADVKVSPASTVVIESGKSKTFYLLVSPAKGADGLKTFTATVTSGAEQLEQLDFTLNVQPDARDSWSDLKKAIGVIVLVLVVLLIILGLILGFSRLGDDASDDDTKTYY